MHSLLKKSSKMSVKRRAQEGHQTVSFSCVEGTTAFSPQPGLGSYLTSFERLLQVSAIYESVNAHKETEKSLFFVLITKRRYLH